MTTRWMTMSCAVARPMCGALLMTLAASSPAWSQSPLPPPVTATVNMTGPRFGMTVLSQESVDTLRDEHAITVRPIITQFGWQFERRFYTNGDGVTLLHEWVPLISGLEQGVALPSFNWLVGLRTRSGTEFGLGPNITPLGVGLVAAAGITVRSGGLHVPFNFAIATSKTGARVSVMTGFNLRR
jgi:hypothetical protein